MKLVKLTKLIKMIYTLSLFNTGQVTLPKKWRSKYKTKKFIAKETRDGLLIKPVLEKDVAYYENRDGFGIYCEDGLPVDDIINKIQELNEQD